MRIVFLPLALLCLSSYIFAQVANHEPSGDSLSPGPLRQPWEERTQGKNLALGKELLFSSPPSYHLTRSDSDPFDLTDGKLSTVKDDLIWFGKDAVGWFGGTADSGVNLYIDLGKVENIEKLVIRCLGGESQRTLSLPRKLEVYVSRDGQRYYAASSLQKLQGAEKELSDFKQNYYLEESGKAYIYPFELAVNAEARYVGLTIYSYAGGLFSDELAIIEGEPQSEGFNLAYQQSSVPFHISGVLVRPRMDEFVVSSNINTPNFFNIRDMRSEDQAKAPIMLDIDAPAALKVLSPSPLNEAEYRSAEGQKRVKFTMQVKPKAWSNSQVNEIYFSCSCDRPCPHSIDYTDCKPCQYNKPEGIPIEFADTVIRIGDYLGHEKVDAERTVDDGGIDATDKDWIPEHIRKDMKTFQGFIATGHWLLSHAYEYRIGTWSTLIFTILAIEEFCQNNGIDLDRAIKLKMEYNKTRPYKHGKKI